MLGAKNRMSEIALSDEQVQILFFLETNPTEASDMLSRAEVDDLKDLQSQKMIYFTEGALFYITHLGIDQLRLRGKRKRLGQLEWKHNVHEMDADLAMQLFGPPPFAAAIAPEGPSLVNEKPRKPKRPRRLTAPQAKIETNLKNVFKRI